MKQPVRSSIKEKNSYEETPIYTLLVDGNNLLKICFSGDRKVSEDGTPIRGIYNQKGEYIGTLFQFLLKLKIMFNKKTFDFVYVFWDGDMSGKLRYNIYSDYKANRDKNYSEYDKKIDNFVKAVLNKNKPKKIKTAGEENEKVEFNRQKELIQEFLEELFIRQVVDREVEGDDLIAYYCLNKKNNEKIIIMSEDADLTQLLEDDIAIYLPRDKSFLTNKIFLEKNGFTHENVLLKKIICGDVSDNIKGIKGVGEDTLLKHFPELKTKKITDINYIIDKSRKINEERILNKKKSLSSLDNIINKVTDGIQGDEIYEINERIINLKKPLISTEAKEIMNDIMYTPIDPENRGMENVYKLLKKYNVDELLSDNKFSNFFSDFKKIIDKELKYYNENTKK